MDGYVIRGRCDFRINGVSARTVGLVVDALRPPPMAKQRHTVWQTGIDTDFSSPDDTYESPEYHITARIIKQPNFNTSPVYAFLADAKTLTLSNQQGFFFRVQQVLGVNPTSTARGNEQTYDIGFILAPFKYHIENTEIEITEDTLQNPGTRYSRPIYRITHTGACSLTVNGDVLRIAAGAPSPIFVDAERMIAYGANGDNATKYTTGDFAFLKPGVNAITTSGCTVAVTGNWRDY